MKTISITLLFLISVISLCCTGALSAMGDTLSEKFTLIQAWQKVVAENDSLVAARENIAEAKYKQDAAKDLYYPEVGLSATYLYLDNDVTLSPDDILESMPAGSQLAPLLQGLPPSVLHGGLTSTIAERQNLSSSLQAHWPIYAGGRIDAAQDIAEAKYKEADWQLTTQVQTSFKTLVRYYFGAVLAKQVLDTRIDVETGLKEHRNHAVFLEKQGLIAKVERMQSEASYDKAKVERRKAERDLEIARAALTRMLKNKTTTIPGDTLFINTNLPTLQSFIEKTLATHPGLGILESKKEQASGLVTVEKGKYLPSVALFGNYSIYEEDNLATKLVPDWFVGVGLKIPLLERSGRLGKVNAAKSMIRRINAMQIQARSDLSLLVEKTYRQAQQALEEYNGLRSSLKLAEETVNLRSKAFNQGLSTSLDVVDAEMFLAGVKTQRAVAIFNYDTALAQLLAVSGELENFFQYQQTEAIEVE